jgi:hypothetical protein
VHRHGGVSTPALAADGLSNLLGCQGESTAKGASFVAAALLALVLRGGAIRSWASRLLPSTGEVHIVTQGHIGTNSPTAGA